MPYQRLLSLSLTHDYYSQQSFSDLEIEPTGHCRKLVRNHRLLLKPYQNGWSILMPISASQQPLIELAENLAFTFQIKLRNTGFASFTQLDADYDAMQSLYVFTNQSLAADDVVENTVRLSSTLIQQSELTLPLSELSPLQRRLSAVEEVVNARKEETFGIVEIMNNSSLSGSISDSNKDEGNDLQQSRHFEIVFSAKQQIWKYYLVAESNSHSDTFSIEDKSGQIAFGKFEIDAGDRILSILQHQYPTGSLVLFQSKQPVPCQKTGRQNIQLIKAGNSQPWIPHLPNPPNQHGIQVINLLQAL